jgi:hypothetical protein
LTFSGLELSLLDKGLQTAEYLKKKNDDN